MSLDQTHVNKCNDFSIGVVPGHTPLPDGVKRLQVILIRPSRYDDDGYVLRYVRGVLPSNTLATLAGLTQEVAKSGSLGSIDIETVVMDELVQKINARRIRRKYLHSGTAVIVALCGVQTNQFPRASDLALEFKAAGLPVMIGGFHVSGAIALSKSGFPPECQRLIDEGITLVKGEVEECWADLLRDALHARLKTFYDVITPPDISQANIPVVNPKLMKRYAYPFMGTIDAGRGCPFNCSFCTIINVQGNKMRSRKASMIKSRIRENAKNKIDYYFFTDDNFSRNPCWEEILDELIDLRENESINISFMMQVDVLATRLPGFIEKAQRAGCTQVFIGMESINPKNLEAVGKRQNIATDYASMIAAWRKHGIACHVGYIIGFPYDTVESVREDVHTLRDVVKADQASFFMLTPLPGSMDFVKLQDSGAWIEPDYNLFDSFHVNTRHPEMSADEWLDVFQESWREFYCVDSMKAILSRSNENTYWGLFKNFMWYKYAIQVERNHPMIAGFLRLKSRRQRRPGYKVDPFWRYMWGRTREILAKSREILKLYFELQEVWLATHGRIQLEANMEELQRRYVAMLERLGESRTWAEESFARQVASIKAGAGVAMDRAGQMAGDIGGQWDKLLQSELVEPRMRFWRKALNRLNPLNTKIDTRTHLNNYWRQTYQKLRHGRILRINPFSLVYNLVYDIRVCIVFNLVLIMGHNK
jgi:radical SAM superfamily enzyme YgiQ (UPF0313 family)